MSNLRVFSLHSLAVFRERPDGYLTHTCTEEGGDFYAYCYVQMKSQLMRDTVFSSQPH